MYVCIPKYFESKFIFSRGGGNEDKSFPYREILNSIGKTSKSAPVVIHANYNINRNRRIIYGGRLVPYKNITDVIEGSHIIINFYGRKQIFVDR